MLFADDVILCGNASVAEATIIRHIFQNLPYFSGALSCFGLNA
jgi:hypothetical protein